MRPMPRVVLVRPGRVVSMKPGCAHGFWQLSTPAARHWGWRGPMCVALGNSANCSSIAAGTSSSPRRGRRGPPVRRRGCIRSDLVVLGTDTDAGKTTFALLWLAAFADRYEYWKPIETGPSDAARIAELAPAAVVHPVVKRFARPVAPPLAAKLENDCVPLAAEIAACKPIPPDRDLLIETFGSPFSPLNEH